MKPTSLLSVSLTFVGVIGAFLLGGYVEYVSGLPYAIALEEPGFPSGAGDHPNVRTDVPIVSSAQGAQDAPRADVPMGAGIDFKRCVSTMVARRESDAEARQVCGKLISGISH